MGCGYLITSVPKLRWWTLAISLFQYLSSVRGMLQFDDIDPLAQRLYRCLSNVSEIMAFRLYRSFSSAFVIWRFDCSSALSL